MAHHLTVYESPYPKIRLGRKNDGGYVCIDLPDPKYDLFLSGGIGKDCSFENAFCERYGSVPGFAFDGTIKHTPSLHPNVLLIRKNISSVNTPTHTNLKEYMKGFKDIFMKMDIEGGENYLFSVLQEEDLKCIKQLVIEFHSHEQVKIPTMLNKTHWLVHLHPNNNRQLVLSNGLSVPSLFECTYIRKDTCAPLSLNTRPIPDPEIDQKNVLHKPEQSLSGPPFVWPKIAIA